MKLHHRQWGSGDRVALLLHGMMGSSDSWWRVARELADRGYRVIALDLPGHGKSPRDPNATMNSVNEWVTETLRQLDVAEPELAIGHSFGGTVLAAGIDRLRPERSIYVDAPFVSRGGWDFAQTLAEYEESRASRTLEGLRERRPHYSERDREVEAHAAVDFDPATAARLAAGVGADWTPSHGLMVRARPSDYVTDEIANQLRSRGVMVRDIPGAAHSVWYSHFDEFMAVINDRL